MYTMNTYATITHTQTPFILNQEPRHNVSPVYTSFLLCTQNHLNTCDKCH